MDRQKAKRYVLLFLALSFVVLVDQTSKYFVKTYMQLGESFPVAKGLLHITYVQNTGAVFGLFKDSNSIFIWLSVIILGSFIYAFDMFDIIEKYLIAFISGAISGNLIDRIVHGHVVDFIDLRIWPVFNVADAVVTVCVVVMVVYSTKRALKRNYQHANYQIS